MKEIKDMELMDIKKFYQSNKEIEIEFTDKKIRKATMIKPVIRYNSTVNDKKEYDITDPFKELSYPELINVFSKKKINSIKEENKNKENKVVMSINLDIKIEIKNILTYQSYIKGW